MPTVPRRFALTGLITAGVFIILLITSFGNVRESARHTPYGQNNVIHHSGSSNLPLTGHVIAPKLGNETAKKELGRAAWKLFHTMFARFPDKPTAEESTALDSYIHLFQRLYPCGECAAHFGEILAKFPPQVSSRSAAAAWGCHVHNEVNKSLKKELFDCSDIGDFYDCGCAEDGDEKGKKDQKHAAGEARDSAKLPAANKEGCDDSDKCEWDG